MSQLPLPFATQTDYAPESFVASAANAHALEWVQRWPDWPQGALCLYGPAGCGKTHLAHVWAARAHAVFVPFEQLDDAAATPPAAAVVEQVHRIDASEEALLHFYNALHERGGHLLLTSRFAPARMAIVLRDLASRLRSLPAVAMDEPDDALLAAVLRKHFDDRQLSVGDDVIAYLLPRMERSFAAARTLAARLDAAALREQRRISVALARTVFAD